MQGRNERVHAAVDGSSAPAAPAARARALERDAMPHFLSPAFTPDTVERCPLRLRGGAVAGAWAGVRTRAGRSSRSRVPPLHGWKGGATAACNGVHRRATLAIAGRMRGRGKIRKACLPAASALLHAAGYPRFCARNGLVAQPAGVLTGADEAAWLLSSYCLSKAGPG